MAVSTVPAAKSALLAAIQARPALAGVLVARGLPAQLPREPERIYIHNARDVDREWAGLGGQLMDETYVIEIIVETFGSGDDQVATENRLWTLINEIELAVRADLTLANTIRTARPDGSTEDTGPTDEGWLARATTRIACVARI